MILDEFEERLKRTDDNVFYGIVDKKMMDTLWNYTVYHRSAIRLNGTKTGFSDVITVTIVRENFIPNADIENMIKEVTSIPGVRLSGNDGVFQYTEKPGTNMVVELFTVDFVKPRKA